MQYADFLNSLDRHQGATTAILTAALVLVTLFYAWQNRKMVREMKKARDAAVLPKLALDLHALGPTVFDLAIKNVGPGAALNIDVHAEWIPSEASTPVHRVRWRRNILASGEQIELFPPGDLNGNIESLPETYKEICLVGKMGDAVGNAHDVDERFANLPEWGELVRKARQSWRPPEPEQRAAEAMLKKFERPLKDLTSATNEIARALHEKSYPS